MLRVTSVRPSGSLTLRRRFIIENCDSPSSSTSLLPRNVTVSMLSQYQKVYVPSEVSDAGSVTSFR